MIILRFTVIILAAIVASAHAPILAQEGSTNNKAVLKEYFEPKSVTELEWRLIEFNILWHGSFVRNANYITSYPVYFDAEKFRFWTIFNIGEQREYKDPEPFFQLPRPRREAILQSGTKGLIELLGISFPEIKSNPSLLYVEFKFRSSGGGSSTVAKFENGALLFAE